MKIEGVDTLCYEVCAILLGEQDIARFSHYDSKLSYDNLELSQGAKNHMYPKETSLFQKLWW
jgi:hypothetical protein